MSESSVILKSKTKKRKCSKEEEQEEEPLQRVSAVNSSETESSSLIPNSQDSVHISQCNIVTGRRQRKERKF